MGTYIVGVLFDAEFLGEFTVRDNGSWGFAGGDGAEKFLGKVTEAQVLGENLSFIQTWRRGRLSTTKL